MKEFAVFRAKTYSYLTDNNNEDKKKSQGTKKCVNIKLKFEDYKHCLKANQLETRINGLENNNLDVDNLWENDKEFIKKTIN